MPRVRLLQGVAGGDFSWSPGEEVTMSEGDAAKWGDGIRGELVADTAPGADDTAAALRKAFRLDPDPDGPRSIDELIGHVARVFDELRDDNSAARTTLTTVVPDTAAGSLADLAQAAAELISSLTAIQSPTPDPEQEVKVPASQPQPPKPDSRATEETRETTARRSRKGERGPKPETR